jgi:NTP pyrophosphatase (non-canonical NTP hydrolase)
MEFNEYSKRAAVTDTYAAKKRMDRLIYSALGLAGEAGEFSEKIKKVLRDENGAIISVRRAKLRDELGDVLWYLAKAARELGISLEEVARANLRKIYSRKKRGKISGSGDYR